MKSLTGISRSSHPRCSVRKGVVSNFAKLTGKQCVRPATLLKKETLAQVFSCEFCEISKNTFFTEHLQIITSLSFVQVHDKCTKSTL